MRNISTQVGYDAISDKDNLGDAISPAAADPAAKPAQEVNLAPGGSVSIAEMPKHLAAPGGAPTVLRSGTCFALQNTTQRIFGFSAEQGQPMIFTRYRLIVDKIGFMSNVAGTVVPPFFFSPRIGGAQVLTNHGTFDPASGLYLLAPFFPSMDRKTVGLNAPNGFDMVSDTGWIPCQVYLPAGREFSWTAINGGGFDRYFTVHLEGYISNGGEDIGHFSPVG